MAKRNLSFFRNIGKNIKKNATMTTLKATGWTAFGAFLYAIVPTAIQGLFKTDMSGWKGWITGTAVGNLIGAAMDKKEIMFGASGMAVGHLLYVKANPHIANVLGSPIFSFQTGMSDRYLTQLQDRYISQLNDNLAPNQRMITLPSGDQIVANTGPTEDMIVAPALNDYAAQLPSEIPMSVLEQNYGINDGYVLDYEQQVANGMLF